MAVTSQQIIDFLLANPGMSDAQIVAAMEQYGVSPAQMAQAVGLSEGEVAARVGATLPPNEAKLLGDTYVQAVNQVIGSGEDQQVGALENVITYKASENQAGGNINYYSPTGEYQQTTQQQEVAGSFLEGLGQAITDPVVLAALAGGYGAGLFGGAGLGAATAGTVGTTGLTVAELAQLDLALGGAGGTAGANSLATALTTGANIGTLTNLTGGSGTGLLADTATSTLTGTGTGTGTGLGTGTGTNVVTGLGTGTGITTGTSGLGLTTTGTGLGTGISTGTGLTGTGVLTGSGLGTSLLGTGTGALTGTGILTGSTLGTTLLGTGTGTGVTGALTTGLEGLSTGLTGLGTGLTSGLSGLGTGLGTGLTGLGTGIGTGLTNAALANLISTGLTTGAGLLQQQTSKEAAQRAQAMIDAETAAAKQSAAFRPIGMTTRFGTSQFAVDPVTGQLTSAGYTLSPEAKNAQDRLVKLAESGLVQAEGAQAQFAPLQTGAQTLFGLGNQYLAQNPQDVAQNYLNQQMALLQPGRELELANLQNRLQQQGRGGLSVAQGGTLGATTPELQALYNARATQEAQLAAQAQQAGQQQVLYGAGLLGQGTTAMGNYYAGQQGAYAPYATALGQVQGLEQMAQQPFTMAQTLAQQSSAAGARMGELGLGGAKLSTALATSPAATANLYSTALGGLGASPAFGQVAGGLLGGGLSGLQSMFSNTGLGTSGFGTGLAYGNQDLGLYL